MAVPFLVVFLADHPRPTRRQGSGGGPPPQDLRTAGQPRSNSSGTLHQPCVASWNSSDGRRGHYRLYRLVEHGEQLAGQVSTSICWRSRTLNGWIVRAAS